MKYFLSKTAYSCPFYDTFVAPCISSNKIALKKWWNLWFVRWRKKYFSLQNVLAYCRNSTSLTKQSDTLQWKKLLLQLISFLSQPKFNDVLNNQHCSGVYSLVLQWKIGFNTTQHLPKTGLLNISFGCKEPNSVTKFIAINVENFAASKAEAWTGLSLGRVLNSRSGRAYPVHSWR